MESEMTQTSTETTQKKDYPEIKDRTGVSILIMFLFGILPGLIALIYTNKATNFYSQAMASEVENVRDSLYAKAVQKDKTSKTWIIIGVAIPATCILIGILAAILSN